MKILSYLTYLIESLKRRFLLASLKCKAVIVISFLLFIWYLFCLPDPLFNVPYSTVVSDRNGELLGARIASDQQWRFPPVDSVPEKYKICVVEFEDRYYKYHWGVNPLSIIRAIKQNLSEKKVVSGGSTVTMQTIRLSRKKDRTVWEKFIEVILATRLEFSSSKDEIIELYASHAPMGGNVVGIGAASWRYFGHDAAQLSWSEAATLAVLPNSPSMMNFGKNRDDLLNKRNRLLKRLYEQKFIDKTDYDLALSEPLPFQPYALPQFAPHLVTKIYIEHPGQNICSTVDKRIQLQLEDVLNRWNAEFSQNGINNISALIIDVEKNEVVSYCGNVHFRNSMYGNQVDIIQSPRSTGSILKPFLYCDMLKEGSLLPNQLVPDIPISVNGFAPKNFSLQYDGAAPASEALARSLNIPFVVLLRKYNVGKFYSYLKEIGITTLNRPADDYGLSLILGGAEAKLWDLCSAYTRMAQSLNDYNANSKYILRPDISYILSKEDKEEKYTESNILDPGAVWLTFEALTNVNRPEEIDWKSIPSMQKIAWKTGTSFGFRDGWAVGVNKKYVVGVWVGNADGEGRPGLVGANTAGMVLFDVFNILPSGKWFSRPDGKLVKTEVCKESGFLKSVNCPDLEGDTIYVCKNGLHADVCRFHQIVHVSEDMQYRVFEDCAGARGIIHIKWFVLPPSWEWFYKQQHPGYRSLPSYSPECQGEAFFKQIEFIYPFYNAMVSLPKQLDGSDGRVVFEIAVREPAMKVYWHLDGQYLGETQDFHKMECSPVKGEHLLTVVDENGYSVTTRFTVK